MYTLIYIVYHINKSGMNNCNDLLLFGQGNHSIRKSMICR